MSLIKTKRNYPTFGSLFTDWAGTENFFDTDWIKPNIPAVNVKENETNFQIEVAAPGLSKKDFEITVDKGILSISANKETESEEKQENYTRKEFSYTSFNRSFSLPENTLEEAIEAKYEDGILILTVQKKTLTQKPEKKAIEIK